jgi:hypothetical protein
LELSKKVICIFETRALDFLGKEVNKRKRVNEPALCDQPAHLNSTEPSFHWKWPRAQSATGRMPLSRAHEPDSEANRAAPLSFSSSQDRPHRPQTPNDAHRSCHHGHVRASSLSPLIAGRSQVGFLLSAPRCVAHRISRVLLCPVRCASLLTSHRVKRHQVVILLRQPCRRLELHLRAQPLHNVEWPKSHHRHRGPSRSRRLCSPSDPAGTSPSTPSAPRCSPDVE